MKAFLDLCRGAIIGYAFNQAKKPKALFSLKVLPGASFSNSDLFLLTGSSFCDKII